MGFGGRFIVGTKVGGEKEFRDEAGSKLLGDLFKSSLKEGLGLGLGRLGWEGVLIYWVDESGNCQIARSGRKTVGVSYLKNRLFQQAVECIFDGTNHPQHVT